MENKVKNTFIYYKIATKMPVAEWEGKYHCLSLVVQLRGE